MKQQILYISAAVDTKRNGFFIFALSTIGFELGLFWVKLGLIGFELGLFLALLALNWV